MPRFKDVHISILSKTTLTILKIRKRNVEAVEIFFIDTLFYFWNCQPKGQLFVQKI